jgi:hypothetical protein
MTKVTLCILNYLVHPNHFPLDKWENILYKSSKIEHMFNSENKDVK